MLYRSLPKTIQSKGITFVLNIEASHDKSKIGNTKYRTIKVLSKNLQNRIDLHLKPYTPSKFIFTEKK